MLQALARQGGSGYHEFMSHNHERGRKRDRVAEPVQVYLSPPDRERLERLASQLDATKSDVLRRGLEALESQHRRPTGGARAPTELPTFGGNGLQPGIDLDDSASLLDRMNGGDAAG